MSDLEKLSLFCKHKIKEHPKLRDIIADAYFVAEQDFNQGKKIDLFDIQTNVNIAIIQNNEDNDFIIETEDDWR